MLLKKRKKLLSLLAALVMTLSISSVALAAGFNTIAGDGVFREVNTSLGTLTTNRYETQIEATINQENMLLNLNIDYVSGKNLIRQISVVNANLTLKEADQPLVLGKYSIDPSGQIYAWVRATILTKGSSTPSYQDVIVLVGNNLNIPPFGEKDFIAIVSPDEIPLLVLVANKSTIQLSNQNAQGGQNQQ